jgi:hypothetical protein
LATCPIFYWNKYRTCSSGSKPSRNGCNPSTPSSRCRQKIVTYGPIGRIFRGEADSQLRVGRSGGQTLQLALVRGGLHEQLENKELFQYQPSLQNIVDQRLLLQPYLQLTRRGEGLGDAAGQGRGHEGRERQYLFGYVVWYELPEYEVDGIKRKLFCRLATSADAKKR